MKRVLILNPPNPDNYYINRDLMGGMGVKSKFGFDIRSKLLAKIKSNLIKIPVLQLVYATTILHNNNFNIKVIDAPNENKSLEEIIPEIINFNPHFVIVAVSSSCFVYERDVVAKTIKDKCDNPTTIAIGEMITEMPKLLIPNFDIGIMNEIETCIVDICNNKDLAKINGIAYKTKSSIKINCFGNRLTKKELEKLPLPKWELFPYQNYCYHPMLSVKPIATILSSRGCPYGCGYCPYPKNQGNIWRARNAENIFEEIMHDIKNYGFKGFFFRDPLFSLDIKRIEKLCDLIIRSGIKIRFVFETRPELLTKDLIKKLYIAGCRSINFGIEDIHPEILTQINRKPINLNKALEIINYCEKISIRTSCFFILGLPGSTKEKIEETIKWSLKLFPSQIEYKIATPFPGTNLYKIAKENNWIREESFGKLGGYSAAMQISEELDPEYLEKRTIKAFNQFYYRPKYILRELIKGHLFLNTYFYLSSLYK